MSQHAGSTWERECGEPGRLPRPRNEWDSSKCSYLGGFPYNAGAPDEVQSHLKGQHHKRALDYVRQFAATGVAPRLLFLTHRYELLDQARKTFRHAMQDPAFGEVLDGSHKPEKWDHVFASIQSAASTNLLDRFPRSGALLGLAAFRGISGCTFIGSLIRWGNARCGSAPVKQLEGGGMEESRVTKWSVLNLGQRRAAPASVRCAGGIRGALSLASLALGLSACGLPESQDDDGQATAQSFELKNGTIADETTKWRGVVKLSIYAFDNPMWVDCSGFITSRNTLVTAAHCVTQALGLSTSGYTRAVVTRETSPGVYQTILPSSTVHVAFNPAYNGFALHDVAVMTSLVDWPFITQSDAIGLGKGTPSGVSMWALGYGNYDDNSNDGQGRAGRLTPTYGSHEYTFISNTSADPQLCSGDSGGPLKMVSGSAWYAYGVASIYSHNAPGTHCGPFGEWASTADNLDWLRSAIGWNNCFEGYTGVFCW